MSNVLRQFIREAISDNIRERITGFVDEVVQLTKDITAGHKDSINQFKNLAKEIDSIIKFFERNDEELLKVAFKRLQEHVALLVKLTSFWNRPTLVGKKAYLEKVKVASKAINQEAIITRKLMGKVKRKQLD